jgi:hypothetical protein
LLTQKIRSKLIHKIDPRLSKSRPASKCEKSSTTFGDLHLEIKTDAEDFDGEGLLEDPHEAGQVGVDFMVLRVFVDP